MFNYVRAVLEGGACVPIHLAPCHASLSAADSQAPLARWRDIAWLYKIVTQGSALAFCTSILPVGHHDAHRLLRTSCRAHTSMACLPRLQPLKCRRVLCAVHVTIHRCNPRLAVITVECYCKTDSLPSRQVLRHRPGPRWARTGV